MTGVTAAIMFPLMRELDPALPAFSAYSGSHADLGAGQIMARVFFACDAIQLGAAVLATLTFAIVLTLFARGPGKALLGVRLALLLVLLAVLGYYLFVLTPPMNQSLRAYWEAARAGDTGAASVHKADFDAAHPVAADILKLLTILVFLNYIAAAWAIARNTGPAKDEEPTSGLEEPRLATGP